VEELTEKEYKQLRTKTGGEKSSGNVRSQYIDHWEPPTWASSPECRCRQHLVAVWATQQIRSRPHEERDHQEARRPPGQTERSERSTKMHKGEVPSQIFPTNDAALPSWECQQQYPKPSWDRGTKYGGENPTRQHIRSKTENQGYSHLTHTKMWVWLITLLVLMHIPTAKSRSHPQCFLAVNDRNGWWNARLQGHLITEDRPLVTDNTGMKHTCPSGYSL
jgi:hypothetical protein